MLPCIPLRGWPPELALASATGSRMLRMLLLHLKPPSKCLPLPPCRERFELALASPAANEADGEAAGSGERYRFSRCTRPLPAALMAKLGVGRALVSRGLVSSARTCAGHAGAQLAWSGSRRQVALGAPCCR